VCLHGRSLSRDENASESHIVKRSLTALVPWEGKKRRFSFSYGHPCPRRQGKYNYVGELMYCPKDNAIAIKCKWWLDSNPQTWVHKSIVLPAVLAQVFCPNDNVINNFASGTWIRALKLGIISQLIYPLYCCCWPKEPRKVPKVHGNN